MITVIKLWIVTFSEEIRKLIKLFQEHRMEELCIVKFTEEIPKLIKLFQEAKMEESCIATGEGK